MPAVEKCPEECPGARPGPYSREGMGSTTAEDERWSCILNRDTKGVNKRSIFLTHKTRTTFSKKYFEDKNAKNTYKTKNKANRKDYVQDEKC